MSDDEEDWGSIPRHLLTNGRVISEDTIDDFIFELHSACVINPIWFIDDDEGYASFHEFIHDRFDKFWSPYIKERNYN